MKASPGKCTVTFQVISHQEYMAVEAPSKGLSVALSEELIRGLESMAAVSYTLN